LLFEIVVVLLQIFLRALELPIRHAEDDSETDQDHKFKPGKFALHSMSILFDLESLSACAFARRGFHSTGNRFRASAKRTPLCGSVASNPVGGAMTTNPKPTHTQPGGYQDPHAEPDDGVVNDSLGSVDIADSTGLDESKETGDAKRLNKNTRED